MSIETFRMDNAICPSCGYRHEDSWELYLRDGETTTMTCGSCEFEFTVECHIDTSYTTYVEDSP